MRRSTISGLAALAGAALVLGGCAPAETSDETSVGSTPSASTSVAPSSTATHTQTATMTTQPSAPNSDEPAPSIDFGTAPTSASPATPRHDYEITATRVGSHEGYDRVVVEFNDASAAGLEWLAEYDENPVTQGRGDAVALPGTATLRVIVRGMAVPPTGQLLQGLQEPSALGVVTGVYVDPVFEGQSVVFVGLDAERGFVIQTLDSPARLVIDIQNG